MHDVRLMHNVRNPGLKFHGGHGSHCRRALLIGLDALGKRKIITAKVAVPYIFPTGRCPLLLSNKH